jgi:hypothetical protein
LPYYFKRGGSSISFFVNRTLALKETPNSTKHLKKNENYNEILEKPFIFNLQTMSTTHRHCRSSLSRLDIVGCGQEVGRMLDRHVCSANLYPELQMLVSAAAMFSGREYT